MEKFTLVRAKLPRAYGVIHIPILTYRDMNSRVEVTIRFDEILRPFCFESDNFFRFDIKLANSGNSL